MCYTTTLAVEDETHQMDNSSHQFYDADEMPTMNDDDIEKETESQQDNEEDSFTPTLVDDEETDVSKKSSRRRRHSSKKVPLEGDDDDDDENTVDKGSSTRSRHRSSKLKNLSEEEMEKLRQRRSEKLKSLSKEEIKELKRRKKEKKKSSKYHKLAQKSKLVADEENCGGDVGASSDFNKKIRRQKRKSSKYANEPIVEITFDDGLVKTSQTRQSLFTELVKSGGDTQTSTCQTAIQDLHQNYDTSDFDPRGHTPSSLDMEGTWVTLSKPQFPDCLGFNAKGECMYTLGRMSFGMFRPTNLVCSLQGIFNVIDQVDGTDAEAVPHVPKSLLQEVRDGKHLVRSYK